MEPICESIAIYTLKIRSLLQVRYASVTSISMGIWRLLNAFFFGGHWPAVIAMGIRTRHWQSRRSSSGNSSIAIVRVDGDFEQ